jgi:hypothetical protein
MSSSIQNILTQLVSGFGHDAVRQACLKFCTGSKGKSATASSDSDAESAASGGKKAKKTRTPRGPNSWTLFVTDVLTEMQAAAAPGEKITRKMAMAEAGKRKRAEAGPEAEEKYQAAKAKKAEKKAAKSSPETSPEASDAEEEEASEAEEKKPQKPVKKAVKKA